jgi:5-hydroxyisourate hydrolase-like protein (transthyretin family)
MKKKVGLLTFFTLFLFMGIIMAGTGIATSQVLDTSNPADGCTEAIQGATVVLYTDGFEFDYETTTNEDCQWSLTLEAGTYTVIAAKDGFFSNEMRFTILQGQSRNPTPLWLSPAVETTGNLNGVVYFNGNPVADANVFVTNGFDVASNTITDEEGVYQFNDIPSGTYDLTASKAKYLDGNAIGVEVDVGQTTGQDLELQAGKIYGIVTDKKTGLPLQGVAVKIYSLNEGLEYNTITDESGYYEVDALLIKYRVEFTFEGYRDHVIDEAPWFDATSGDTEYNVELIPKKMTVSGIVHDQTGVPVNGATVEISEECGEAPVETDAEGHYEFRCSAGTYQLTASKNGYYPNTVEVTGGNGELVEQNIEIEYFPNARLRVISKDTADNPIVGANVQVFVAGGEEAVLTGTTNGAGTATFTYTPTGDYYAIVSKDGYNTEQSEVFTLEDKVNEDVNVILTKNGLVKGKVTPVNGTEGIPGIEITVKQGETEIAVVYTDENGRYEVSGLEEGAYTVSLYKDEFHAQETKTFTIDLAQLEVTRNFELQIIYTNIGVKVRGIFGDGTNAFLDGATVTLIGQGLELIGLTNGEGEFIFEHIPAGEYDELRAEKDGFTVSSLYGVLAEPELTHIKDVTVYELGSLSGTATTWTDARINGVLIRATRDTTSSDLTDATGNYLINGLAPGGYTVSAMRSGCVFKSYTGVAVNTGQDTVRDFQLQCNPSLVEEPA